MSADDAWAPLAERFVDRHYGTLRGRVRTHVIAAHLRAHLPGPPAALADVGLGLDARADTVEGLTEVLAESGVQRIAWYGVRLFTDRWTPAQLGADAEEQALEVELQASQRDPYRLMSRLFHLIGRRLPSR